MNNFNQFILNIVRYIRIKLIKVDYICFNKVIDNIIAYTQNYNIITVNIKYSIMKSCTIKYIPNKIHSNKKRLVI